MKATITEITFACPHCHQKIRDEMNHVKGRIACPTCSINFGLTQPTGSYFERERRTALRAWQIAGIVLAALLVAHGWIVYTLAATPPTEIDSPTQTSQTEAVTRFVKDAGGKPVPVGSETSGNFASAPVSESPPVDGVDPSASSPLPNSGSSQEKQTSEGAKVTPCLTWEEMKKRYGTPELGPTGYHNVITELRIQPHFEKDKHYCTVVEIAQINPDSLLAQWTVMGGSVPSFGVFEFEKNRFDSITTEEGDTIQIAGLFKEYRQFAMSSGRQRRLPVFKLVGFWNISRNTFYSFE